MFVKESIAQFVAVCRMKQGSLRAGINGPLTQLRSLWELLPLLVWVACRCMDKGIPYPELLAVWMAYEDLDVDSQVALQWCPSKCGASAPIKQRLYPRRAEPLSAPVERFKEAQAHSCAPSSGNVSRARCCWDLILNLAVFCFGVEVPAECCTTTLVPTRTLLVADPQLRIFRRSGLV